MKNIYKNAIRLITVLLLSIALSSCFKDLGSYDYTEINEISISGINNIDAPYNVSLGDSLKITPELNFSAGENHDTYKYEWHLMGSTSTGSIPWTSHGVISSERNLRITIGGFVTSSGSYYIMYCVTNLTTGIRYDHLFQIDVRDRMLTGYIMLCERENDSFDIDLISLYSDTLTQYHNVLDIYDSQYPRDGRKPIDLLCYGDYISPSVTGAAITGVKKYAIWILTDKSTDRVRVENFEYQPDFDISGLSIMPSRILPKGTPLIAEKLVSTSAHSTTAGANYMLFNGNWYYYNWQLSGYFYNLPINALSDLEEPYKASPFICMRAVYGAVIFDETHNRFEWHKATSSELTGDSKNLYKTTRLTDQTYFDWQNPDYRLVYLANRNATTGFAVVKNVGTGRYEFLQMSIAATVAQLGHAIFPAGFNPEEIEHWGYHPTLPYLYAATDDKVYKLNTTTMAVEDITSQVLTAGHKVSKLKNSAIRFPRTGLIVIATYDPSGAAGQNGQLALYEVEDGTGNLILAKHPVAPTTTGYQINMKWSGFGKIINVDYKQPA
ncbi:MAG: hypothetical protein LBT50_07755 [Prevotellaceae bacterium]|jgi:hypothetical protein|nr:hypothetical protein [Prevotellaceae bacterium]